MPTTDEAALKNLRKDVFLAGRHAGMAHLASAYSCLEILYVLYIKEVMRYNPDDPEWDGRDLFVMSKGHGSLALYAVLAKMGVLQENWRMEFARPGSSLGGEPSLCHKLGIEASTGSLGHGLSLASGMALTLKRQRSSRKVFVLLGDGECEEGSIWEASIAASKYGLDNLVAIIDCNGIQKMGLLDEVVGLESWQNHFDSLGWNCLDVDGHDVEALTATFSEIRENGRPSAVFARTVKGKGVSLMEGNPAWHWRLPNKKETKVLAAELGVSEEELESCKKHI